MIKIVKLEGDIKSNVLAIKKAKELVKKENLVLDFEDGGYNYIYLKGETVSDLVVIRYGKVGNKIVARKCTDEEWKNFFNNHIAPINYDTNSRRTTTRGKYERRK